LKGIIMDAEQIVEKWQEAVNQGQMDAFGALYAPDAVLVVPLVADPVRGREAIQEYEGSVATAFPGATLNLSPLISSGNTIAVEWVYSGTNSGPIASPEGSVPATNRSMKLTGGSFLRFNDEGLITEEHRYYDRFSLMEQLGLQ
jgi:steroid delta-isomerase-like uncharacterized protein